MNISNKARYAAMAAALVVGAWITTDVSAASDSIEFGKEKFSVSLGAYRPNFTTSLAIGTATGRGGTISGEDDLRLDKDMTIFRLDGFWRFADKHRLNFGYYSLNRDTTATLGRNLGPINLPNQGVSDTILAGTNVRAEATWEMYVLSYGYSFYKTNTVELAAIAGLNVARIGTKITGTLNTLSNGVLVNAVAGNNSDVTAPLPVLGVSGDWAFADRWRLKGHIGGFKAKIADVDATVTDFALGTEYRMFKHFGVGAGYTYLKLNADITKPEYNGNANWKTGGWQIFGTMVF